MIEGKKPVVICDSGIIDLLAQMLLAGWISMAGDLNPEASDRIRYLSEEQQYAAVYATESESDTGEPLFFTQTDIRQYLDTKAAAYTMVDCLLDAAGCSIEEISHCYLSGAFSLIRIWNLLLRSECSRIFPGKSILPMSIPLWTVPGSYCWTGTGYWSCRS